MSISIAVLTPAIPERIGLLTDSIASVRAQTLQPAQHVIHIDYDRAGCATVQNRLLAAADTDWVALLADDDIFYPHHLETLAAAADRADIVYTWCDVTGRDGWNPNSRFDPERLRAGNYIPSTTLIRTTLARALGGWRTGAHGFEDWDFWLRALSRGARFHCIPEVTWQYRFLGMNHSLGHRFASTSDAATSPNPDGSTSTSSPAEPTSAATCSTCRSQEWPRC